MILAELARCLVKVYIGGRGKFLSANLMRRVKLNTKTWEYGDL